MCRHRLSSHLPDLPDSAYRSTSTERSPVMSSPHLVGANIDTFIGNARLTGDFPDDLAAHLEELKRRSQEAEEDLPTTWQFAGEVVFIKPHGAGRQWRWILHS